MHPGHTRPAAASRPRRFLPTASPPRTGCPWPCSIPQCPPHDGRPCPRQANSRSPAQILRPHTSHRAVSRPGTAAPARGGIGSERSEEHTSELQSRGHLVCRLLLEKKKKKT